MLELHETFLKLGPESEQSPEIKAMVQRALGSTEQVTLKTLNGGITNQLLKATVGTQRALVRLFGRGTSSFIDRELESAVHLRLAELGMAAPLYARFGNGMIYGWVAGVPAAYTDLSDPKIAPAIARKLGQWHARLDTALFKPDTVYNVIEEWIELVPPGTLPLDQLQLHNEFNWFKKTYGSQGGPLVMGHNDLLCGNILLPSDAAQLETDQIEVQFIDYEYSRQCPRAFDIANHFMEWQGYDCDVAKIPDLGSPQVAHWITTYLKSTGSQDSVGTVVAELRALWGMPGFYWGLWSAIQSNQSDIDFDYKSYAGQRFNEYLVWKQKATGAGLNGTSGGTSV